MPEVEKTSGGRVTVRGIGEFAQGDRADVTEEDAAYLCDERGGFRRVGGDATAAAGPADEDVHEEDGPPDDSTPPFDPSKSTVDEIEAALDDTDHHPVALEALLDAEKAGKNRSTAIEAIQAELDEEA